MEGHVAGDNTSASSSDGDGHENTVQVIMRKEKSNNTDSSVSNS